MKININKSAIKNLSRNKVIKRVGAITLLGTMLLNLTGCNRALIDARRGFDKALITGDDTAIVMDIKEWGDYPGEQLHLVAEDNFTVLASSFDTDQFFGKSSNYNIFDIAKNSVTNEEDVYTIALDDDDTVLYNKDIWDMHYKYNKMFVHNANHGIILPIVEWKDYQGEQIQVIEKDGLVMVTNSYNSMLIDDSKSETKAVDFAQNYLGKDGKVTDYAGNYDSFIYNKTLIDLKYSFNKAIIIKDNTCTILPISSWHDYEGEQLQLSIKGGPVELSAAYDTFLINDMNSKIKAIDIAKSLSDNVIDLAGDFTVFGPVNKNIDLIEGFSNAIVSNGESASAFPIKKWCDYEGEQLQVIMPNNDVLLTSSKFLDLVNGGSENINASTLASSFSQGDKLVDYSNGNTEFKIFNKQIIDLNQEFDYALKVVNGNVTIIPINKWRDFENTDGETWKDAEGHKHKIPDSPNCEQFQVIFPDGTPYLTSAYDTCLVHTKDPMYYAELFASKNGVITDLTEILGEPKHSLFGSLINFDFIDTEYKFTKAIEIKNDTCQVYDITNWYDYAEGEQVQIWFNDKSGELTSYINTSLLKPKTEGLEEILAQAFVGELNMESTKVYKYK